VNYQTLGVKMSFQPNVKKYMRMPRSLTIIVLLIAIGLVGIMIAAVSSPDYRNSSVQPSAK
jgi:hypothetical protein